LFGFLRKLKNIGVIMSQTNKLTDLKNIGKKIAGRLNEVGILSEDDLRQVGSVGAHRMIRERYPDETLSVCYYLYSFEGALTDQHWDEIGEHRKLQLRAQID
jgi:DNA transformation protein and related proteins